MEINKDLLPGQEEYWKDYQVDTSSQNSAQGVEFDKLCFELFELNEQGQKLIEYLVERIIMPSTPAKDSSAFPMTCVYYEGQRDMIRLLRQSAKEYRKRKEAQDKKAIDKAAEGGV